MIFKKVSVIFGRLLAVEAILGSRSNVLVIFIKFALKITDSLLSSETIQSFPEVNILLENFPWSEKYSLINRQKFLMWDKSFGFIFEKVYLI